MPEPTNPPERPTNSAPTLQVWWLSTLIEYTRSEWLNLTGTADDKPDPDPYPSPPPVPDPQPARPTDFALTIQQGWLLELRQWAVTERSRISSGG